MWLCFSLLTRLCGMRWSLCHMERSSSPSSSAIRPLVISSGCLATDKHTYLYSLICAACMLYVCVCSCAPPCNHAAIHLSGHPSIHPNIDKSTRSISQPFRAQMRVFRWKLCEFWALVCARTYVCVCTCVGRYVFLQAKCRKCVKSLLGAVGSDYGCGSGGAVGWRLAAGGGGSFNNNADCKIQDTSS